MQQRDIVLHPYSEKQNHILVIFMFMSYFSYKIIWPDLHISSIVYFLTLWNMWHFPNHITEMHWRYICKDLIYNKSTFDHVMAWFLLAPSHIPIQYWHRYKIQYYMTRPHQFTHFPLDKMAAISQMFLNAFFWMKSFCILIWISMKFVPKGPNDYKPPACVQVMA